MKITNGKFEIKETANQNTLTVVLNDGEAVVELIGKMTLQMIRDALKATGLYTIEADMWADADWCKQILNREKAMTTLNNAEPIA